MAGTRGANSRRTIQESWGRFLHPPISLPSPSPSLLQIYLGADWRENLSAQSDQVHRKLGRDSPSCLPSQPGATARAGDEAGRAVSFLQPSTGLLRSSSLLRIPAGLASKSGCRFGCRPSRTILGEVLLRKRLPRSAYSFRGRLPQQNFP